MLTSLKRMIGMPVVWQDRQLGFVERAVPRADARALSGVVVRKGIGSARWCPADSIRLVGNACVVIDRKPERMTEGAESALGRAFLTTGQCVGEVTDVILRGDTLSLSALEISQGPVYRLMGRCVYASDYHPDPSSGGVVVPELLTWAQLKRQLGEEDDG